MSTLTAIIVLGTLLHAVVLVLMIWIRVSKRTDPVGGTRVTPCAVCGGPSAGWAYDGLDPDEQTDPVTGRRRSFDMSHYRPLCETHTAAVSPAVG